MGAILRPGSYTGAIEPPTVSDNQRLPKAHPEDPADGCPGGWRLSLYAQSVAPYLRTRAGDGHRVPNPLLDRCEDDAIARAVLFYENEHERCIGHTMKVEEKAREDG